MPNLVTKQFKIVNAKNFIAQFSWGGGDRDRDSVVGMGNGLYV